MKRFVISLGTLSLVAASLTAQVTTAPALGPAPALVVPVVMNATLPNGMKIQVARNAEVPLVEARLLIDGGARLRGTPSGLASFTASLLTEGAGGMDALALSEEIAFIGASLNAGAGWENLSLSLSVPKRSMDAGFSLMAKVLFQPNFAHEDVQRMRALRLAALISAKDSPGSVANRVLYRNIYPATHPYHRDLTGDSASVAGFDSVAVRSWWNGASDPRRATLILAGDVTLAEGVAWATKHFGAWKAPTTMTASTPASDIAAPTNWRARVILVDKPEAAQSVILVAGPGMARTAPDYAATTVMNTILGASFSSRLNDILREQLGYTYGAGSGFSVQPVPGPFTVSTAVRTNVTDSSLIVIFRELKAMRDQGVTPQELERGRNYIVLGSLDSYETAGQIAGAISTGHLFGLPLSTVPAEMARINAVTAAEVHAAAKQRLDPSQLTVVVVGDLAKIRAGIEKLGLGPIEVQTYEQ